MEPSGVSVAVVENAINYSRAPWWVKIANPTEYVIFLDKNDVIAYAKDAEVDPLDIQSILTTLNIQRKEENGTEL